MNEVKNVYTIYKNPTDPQDRFLVRQWGVQQGEPDPLDLGIVAESNTLEGARALLRDKRTILPSTVEDLQVIETWI